MTEEFGYQAKNAVTALAIEDQYIWDCAVIRAEGKYHMFSSGWDRRLGFGWNWLFNSQVFHSVSDTPEGPYQFQNVVLPCREIWKDRIYCLMKAASLRICSAPAAMQAHPMIFRVIHLLCV